MYCEKISEYCATSRNRPTIKGMDIILNQIAIWKPCGAKTLSIRKSPTGQKYREPNGVVYKIANKPLFRYAKDYTVKKVAFSLFLRTECDNEKLVENALDTYAKQITKEYALNATATATIDSFEYTPYIFDPTRPLILEDK